MQAMQDAKQELKHISHVQCEMFSGDVQML